MTTMSLLGWLIVGVTMSLAVCFLIAWSVSTGERWACALWLRIRRLWTSDPAGGAEPPNRLG